MGSSATCPEIFPQCQDIDQASSALIQDLKQRGLLEDTLVVWGGEFRHDLLPRQIGATTEVITPDALPCGWQEGVFEGA